MVVVTRSMLPPDLASMVRNLADRVFRLERRLIEHPEGESDCGCCTQVYGIVGYPSNGEG